MRKEERQWKSIVSEVHQAFWENKRQFTTKKTAILLKIYFFKHINASKIHENYNLCTLFFSMSCLLNPKLTLLNLTFDCQDFFCLVRYKNTRCLHKIYSLSQLWGSASPASLQLENIFNHWQRKWFNDLKELNFWCWFISHLVF